MSYTDDELQKFFDELDDGIAIATKHHPYWDDYTTADMVSLCVEEVGEVARALNDSAETDDLLMEITHVAVVAARMYMEIVKRKERGNGKAETRTCSCGSCKCHKRGEGEPVR